MGFGLMTVGYIFLCSFTIGSETMFFDVFPDIVGWVLMALGVSKLSAYSKKMKAAEIPAVILCFISLYTLLHGFNVTSFLGSELAAAIYDAVGYANAVLMLIFHFFMLEGSRDIALQTGRLPGLAAQLRAATVISCVHYILKLIIPAFYGVNPTLYSIGFTAVWLLYVIMLLFNEWLMYRCFRTITAA